MDLLEHFENISEYLGLVCTDDFAAVPRHVKYIGKEMKHIQNNKHYLNAERTYNIALDVAMFCAKLYPMKPRLCHTGTVHTMKAQHERLRKEELLQLKHRITKNIAAFTNNFIYELWKTNPDAILPQSKLKW